MGSSWLFLYPAASGAFRMRASSLSTLLRLTTWGRCSTPSDSVSFVYLFKPHLNILARSVKSKIKKLLLLLFLKISNVWSVRCDAVYPGPNAISVSLSPMGCYVMVGLASRRILLHPTTDHMVAQVFRLQQPHGGETSIRASDGVEVSTRHPVSIKL